MRDVIHAVDEGNLLRIAFHGHVLPIHDQRATEALPVAVPRSDIVVMWNGFQFSYQLPVSSSYAFLLAMGERTNTRTLQMKRKHRFRSTTVIDAEVARAIVAVVAIDASPRSFFPRSQALAKVTSEMASGSVFLEVNMLKDGKWLEHREIYQKVAPEMERSQEI